MSTHYPVVEKTIADVKKGMIEYKTDAYGNVHSIIGKVSFPEKKLKENLEFFVNTIIKAKPAAVKGKLIKNVSICSQITLDQPRNVADPSSKFRRSLAVLTVSSFLTR